VVGRDGKTYPATGAPHRGRSKKEIAEDLGITAEPFADRSAAEDTRSRVHAPAPLDCLAELTDRRLVSVPAPAAVARNVRSGS
jgi:hypothetical protein